MVGMWLVLALAVLTTSATLVYSAAVRGENVHQDPAEFDRNTGTQAISENGRHQIGKLFGGDAFNKDNSFELGSLDGEKKKWPGSLGNDLQAEAESKTTKVQRPSGRCTRAYRTVNLNAGDFAVFTSPGYPYYYPSRVRCGWAVRTASTNTLHIRCPEVTMSRYGYLELWDVDVRKYYRVSYARHGHYEFEGTYVGIGLLNRWYYYNRGFTCKIYATGPSTSKKCVCGVKKGARIVGGTVTAPNKYPWLVYVKIGSSGSCGGILINDRWIATATHCSRAGTISSVVLGQHDATTSTAPAITRTVREIVEAPTYDDPTRHNNDITLLRIDPIDWNANPNIRPICLPVDDSKDYAGEDAITVGWGRTTPGGATSSLLREVTVPVITNAVCVTKLSQWSTITDKMICAGVEGKDSCQGDSGGPLMVANGANYDLIGVVSFGRSCAVKDLPGVYVRVSKFLPWIKTTTGTDGYCPRT